MNIFFETEIGEFHSYYYSLNENYREASFPTKTQNFNLNAHGAISFMMEIDGFKVSVGYSRGDNNHITTFNPVEAYSDMIITSFAEAPWSTISPAVAEELIVEEPLSTADAMTILRTVAGLTAMTEEEAARFEISGAPSTADAMRILRVVAGLV